MAEEENEGVIPEAKIREAHAKCMEDPALAKYFNDAPQGAKEYIALMFYCTVFQDEVNDALYATYQKEVEEELTREDVLYLATHDRNAQSKAHFRDLLSRMPAPPPAPRPAEEPVVQQHIELDTRRLEVIVERMFVSVAAIEKKLAEREAREAKVSRLRTICLVVWLMLVAVALLAGTVAFGVFLLASR